MDMQNLIGSQGVIANLKAGSKKQALQELSARAADITGLSEQEVFNTLLERERLGTTGVGQGVAIPHGKMKNLDKIHGIFARLKTPVDFDSVDDRAVDLIFLLLVPTDAGADHLKALAHVSRMMRDGEIREKLRGSESPDAILALLTASA